MVYTVQFSVWSSKTISTSLISYMLYFTTAKISILFHINVKYKKIFFVFRILNVRSSMSPERDIYEIAEFFVTLQRAIGVDLRRRLI